MIININPPTTSEYLSKDILEEDFMKVFYMPLTIQKLFGVCRVDARDRFVTAPSFLQQIYTIIYCLLTWFICYIAFYIYIEPYASYPRMYYLAICGISTTLVAFLCNAIHVRFVNKDENVMFYIKMQEIDRIMNISQPIRAMLFHTYNFTTICMTIIATALLLLSVFNSRGFFTLFIGLVLSYGTFMYEIAYFSNLIVYFGLRIRFINAIMDNHIHQPIQVKETTLCRTTYSNLKVIASHSHYFAASNTDVYLKSIFELFLKYQDLYRFQVNLNYIYLPVF